MRNASAMIEKACVSFVHADSHTCASAGLIDDRIRANSTHARQSIYDVNTFIESEHCPGIGSSKLKLQKHVVEVV